MGETYKVKIASNLTEFPTSFCRDPVRIAKNQEQYNSEIKKRGWACTEGNHSGRRGNAEVFFNGIG